jgi:prepilin-type N-terminal cleavage/methylation domain-containing protein
LAPPTTSCSAKSPDRGTTLLELLVVLTLIGALLGIGVGFAARLTFPRQAAVESVKGVLQAARAFAVTQGSLARVVASREGRSIQRLGFRTIGEWHFEGSGAEGAFGLTFDLRSARAVEDGRIGSALAFEDGGYAECPVSSLPSWESRDGLAFKADVRLERGGGIVARRGESWRVEVRADGGVSVDVALVSPTKGEGARGERLRVDSAPGLVRPGRWARLSFLYDRTHLRLSVDGIERARSPRATEPLWLDRAALRLSDPERTLHGAIDEVSVAALVVEEPQFLPEGVEFAADADLWFDAAGNLDPARHDGPLAVELKFDRGASRRIEVTTYGTLR